MTRRYGRAARGQRVVARVPRNTGLKLSLIGSLGLRGLVRIISVEGAVDSPVFDAHISRWLVPQLQPEDIVRLDNLPAHGASQVEEAVAGVKAEVLWLSAYSPDFSPIENYWPKFKVLVRGKQLRTPRAVFI